MTHRLAPIGGSAVRRATRITLPYPARISWPLLLACVAPTMAPAQVSITAIDDTARESPATNGRFRVSSAQRPSGSLRVEYDVGGSATPGDDYVRLAGRVMLTPGQPEALITVEVPGDDGRFEGDETVVVTLRGSRDAEGDDDDDNDDDDSDDDDKTGQSATVTIRDSDYAVTIERIADASENPPNRGELQVLLGATNASGTPLAIDYSVGGTASPGDDYEPLPGVAVVGTGSGSATIEVNPINDAVSEGSETVQVTLTGTSNPRAVLGNPSSASIAIADDDSGGGSGSDGDEDDDGSGSGDGNDGGSGDGGTADGDGDGLSDDREEEIGTDPRSADTDRDGVRDGDELDAGTDPLDAASFADADGDLIPDPIEAADSTDPHDPRSYLDSDGGGTADHIETLTFPNLGIPATNAGDAADDRRDLDGDGLPDRLEVAHASDPEDPSSPTAAGAGDDDGDGVSNAVEAHLAALGIPSVEEVGDHDRDGYPDAAEVALGLDPLRADERDGDGDGVPDIIEALAGMDIDTASDSDGDVIPDARELALGADFLDANSPVANGAMDDDGDGISNAVEQLLALLGVSEDVAGDTDSDGDGIADAEEIALGGDPARDEQPVPWIELAQTGIGKVNAVLSGGESASATAVVGGHQSGALSYDWRQSDNAVLAVTSAGQTSKTLEFAPRTLPAGTYRLVVEVQRALGDYRSETSVVTMPLRVLPDAQPSDVADADSDGIPDSADRMDARNGFANELPSGSGTWLQADPGLRLRLGPTATASSATSARVTRQDIANSGGEDGGSVGNSEDEFDYSSGIYDFQVTALPEVGAVVQVVIPQAAAIGEFPEYRKYQPDSGWFGFVEDANNTVASAPGSSEGCPAPGDDSYRAGLTQGDFCVQLEIEDGGPNDADADLGPNGIIRDPGGVATPEGEVVAGSGSGRTSSSTVAALAFLALAVAAFRWSRRRPRRKLQ